MRKYLLFIAILILSHMSYGQNASDIDTSFNIGNGFNSAVSSFSIQSDGKILVGGSFSLYNGSTANRIIRLNNDGSIDNTFTGSVLINCYSVNAIAIQTDGKILLGGDFSYNGRYANNIVRLNNDGSIDNSFVIGSGFNYYVRTIALQPDGKILVGGAFTSFNGAVASRIIRLNVNGSNDATFTAGGFDSQVNCIVLQPDGKILIAGNFYGIYGDTVDAQYISRLNNDGSKDKTFVNRRDYILHSSIRNIILQTDGKIVFGANFPTGTSTSSWRIIRLNVDGSNDTSFVSGNGCPGIADGQGLLESDGKIVFVGRFETFNGERVNGFIRLNTDGSRDNSFFTNDQNFMKSDPSPVLFLQSNGKILVGGAFTVYNGINLNRIMRLQGSSVLSTYNFDKNDFAIYPNPIKDIININLQGRDTSLEYVIYDMSGKKITSNKLLENNIEVSNLSKGIYILKIKTSEKILECKFIKE